MNYRQIFPMIGMGVTIGILGFGLIGMNNDNTELQNELNMWDEFVPAQNEALKELWEFDLRLLEYVLYGEPFAGIDTPHVIPCRITGECLPIRFEYGRYMIDQDYKIIISDPNANINSGLIEEKEFKIISEKYPDGYTLSALETEAGSGLFVYPSDDDIIDTQTGEMRGNLMPFSDLINEAPATIQASMEYVDGSGNEKIENSLVVFIDKFDIRFEQDSYDIAEPFTIIVDDSSSNQRSDEIEVIWVNVWTNPDEFFVHGHNFIPLTETYPNSGTFVGNSFSCIGRYSITPGQSITTSITYVNEPHGVSIRQGEPITISDTVTVTTGKLSASDGIVSMYFLNSFPVSPIDNYYLEIEGPPTYREFVDSIMRDEIEVIEEPILLSQEIKVSGCDFEGIPKALSDKNDFGVTGKVSGFKQGALIVDYSYAVSWTERTSADTYVTHVTDGDLRITGPTSHFPIPTSTTDSSSGGKSLTISQFGPSQFKIDLVDPDLDVPDWKRAIGEFLGVLNFVLGYFTYPAYGYVLAIIWAGEKTDLIDPPPTSFVDAISEEFEQGEITSVLAYSVNDDALIMIFLEIDDDDHSKYHSGPIDVDYISTQPYPPDSIVVIYDWGELAVALPVGDRP